MTLLIGKPLTVCVRLVEVLIGISCACMPAFFKMLQHHLPALKKFRSTISSRFTSLQSRISGSTTDRSGFSQSDVPSRFLVAKADQRLYINLEIELPGPQGATFQPTYELRHLQSVQTFVGKRWGNGASDDNIHLMHEIQPQARTQ